MDITQASLDRAALVIVVDDLGLYEWSSSKTAAEVADYLVELAKAIRSEVLV